ncbi:MAG: LacI family DNA-binding transcriptional regulator [Lentisphaerae bacterium]|nr:LacI family DNA-binding transcriptional regulator [Lentisphaerota bacterium]
MAKDMLRKGSIHCVAKEAGVSIVTVSRVFNDYPHVSARMRERVLSAARECGYTPRVVSKPRVLGALVGHLDSLTAGDYKTRLILYIVQAAARSGYLVEFIPQTAIELATKSLVNGIIQIALTPQDAEALDALPKVPTVVINGALADPSWYLVGSDHYEEARVACLYLLARGHRRIGLVLDELEGWGVENRARGYRDAMQSAGVATVPEPLAADRLSPSEIADGLQHLDATACLNFTDNYGLAVLDHLVVERAVSIPADLSVICLEDSAVSPFYHPRLTTVAQPLDRIAGCVVETIAHLLDKKEVSRETLFESRLIERHSVTAP